MKLVRHIYLLILPLVVLVIIGLAVFDWQEYKARLQEMTDQARAADVESLLVMAGNPLFRDYLQRRDKDAAIDRQQIQQLRQSFDRIMEISRQQRRSISFLALYSDNLQLLVSRGRSATNSPPILTLDNLRSSSFSRVLGETHLVAVILNSDSNNNGQIEAEEVQGYLVAENHLPIAAIEARERERLLRNVLVSLLLLAPMAILLLWAGHSLSTPLGQLAAQANEVAVGKSNARFSRHHKFHEISLLGHSLNLMLEAIHKHQQEVELHRNNLEELVQKRTHALLRANQKLKHEVRDRRRAEALLKQNEARLAHLAHHDALTGLPNRLLFQDRLKRALINARRTKEMVALLFIDLDRFKNINDRLGHDAGDQFLCQAAERLSRAVREMDTVARWAGDEFVVILDKVRDRQSINRIIDNIFAPDEALRGSDDTPPVGMSIGIALFPDHGETVSSLLQAADKAMYRAKLNGRNNAMFYDGKEGPIYGSRVVPVQFRPS